MIYAIEAVGSGFIKFGRAASVGKRLRELDTGCPHELHILAVADWPSGSETAIHRLLSDQCQKLEWFKDCALAKDIITWMGEQDGLAKLHAEVRKMGGRPKWLEEGRPKKNAQPVDDGIPCLRLMEREEWWRKHGQSL
jgi:hypothetical protein